MEREDKNPPGEEQQKQPMAQERDKRKPEEEEEQKDNTVGNVPDPQGEDTERDRSQS